MFCNQMNVIVTLRPTIKFYCYSIKTLKECALSILTLCNRNHNDDRRGNDDYDANESYSLEYKAFHTIIYTNVWDQGDDNVTTNMMAF